MGPAVIVPKPNKVAAFKKPLRMRGSVFLFSVWFSIFFFIGDFFKISLFKYNLAS
jgi:hypothetical protein